MNKILALLFILVVVYQSLSPLVKLFTSRKAGRKEYKITFSKQFNHLFSACLLLLIPLLAITDYYAYYPQLPPGLQIGIAALACLCVISASISFYLYASYVKKTPYHSFVYDPNLFSIELLTPYNRRTIKLNHVRRVQWYSTRKSLKIMPWSNFEYFILELANGNKVIITSLMIAPVQLQMLLDGFDMVPHKKVIPTISISS